MKFAAILALSVFAMTSRALTGLTMTDVAPGNSYVDPALANSTDAVSFAQNFSLETNGAANAVLATVLNHETNGATAYNLQSASGLPGSVVVGTVANANYAGTATNRPDGTPLNNLTTTNSVNALIGAASIANSQLPLTLTANTTGKASGATNDAAGNSITATYQTAAQVRTISATNGTTVSAGSGHVTVTPSQNANSTTNFAVDISAADKAVLANAMTNVIVLTNSGASLYVVGNQLYRNTNWDLTTVQSNLLATALQPASALNGANLTAATVADSALASTFLKSPSTNAFATKSGTNLIDNAAGNLTPNGTNAINGLISSSGVVTNFYSGQFVTNDCASLDIGAAVPGTNSQQWKLQSLLDQYTNGPVWLVMNTRNAVGYLKVGSNTRISALPGCGFIYFTNANSPLLVNAHFRSNSIQDTNIFLDGVTFNGGNMISPSGISRMFMTNSSLGFTGVESSVTFIGVSNVKVRDCNFYNSFCYNLHCINWTNVIIEDCIVDIGNPPYKTLGGYDGFHMNGPGSRSRIFNCDLATGDDAIAFNADDGINPTVSQNYFFGGPISDVTVSQIRFHGNITNYPTMTGFRFLSASNSISDVFVDHVSGGAGDRIILMDNFNNQTEQTGLGYFNNIHISDISCGSYYDPNFYTTQTAPFIFHGVFNGLYFKNTSYTNENLYTSGLVGSIDFGGAFTVLDLQNITLNMRPDNTYGSQPMSLGSDSVGRLSMNNVKINMSGNTLAGFHIYGATIGLLTGAGNVFLGCTNGIYFANNTVATNNCVSYAQALYGQPLVNYQAGLQVNTNGFTGVFSGNGIGLTNLLVTVPNIVERFKYDEATGTNTVDGIRGSNAVLSAGTTWTTGKSGAAVSFYGTNQVTSSDVGFGSASLSVSCWFRTTNSVVSGNYLPLVEIGTRNYNQMFSVNFASDSGIGNNKVVFSQYGGALATGASYNNGLWHHVVVTYAPSTAKIYIDGALSASGSLTYTPSLTGTFYVGGRASAGYFIGDIDDVRFYSSQLSSTDVLNLYNDKAVDDLNTWNASGAVNISSSYTTNGSISVYTISQASITALQALGVSVATNQVATNSITTITP